MVNTFKPPFILVTHAFAEETTTFSANVLSKDG